MNQTTERDHITIRVGGLIRRTNKKNDRVWPLNKRKEPRKGFYDSKYVFLFFFSKAELINHPLIENCTENDQSTVLSKYHTCLSVNHLIIKAIVCMVV